MPRLVAYKDKTYSFQDDTSDEDIAAALQEADRPATWEETVKAIPGEAYRQYAEFGAGLADIAGGLQESLGIGGPKLNADAAGARREIAAERQAETPQNMSLAQEGVLSGGTSILTNIPAAAVGAVAAPFALGSLGLAAGTRALLGGVTTGMGAMTGVQKYGESLDAGLTGGRAAVHGLIHGLIEKYTEYLPLSEFTKSGGRSLLKGLLKETAGEELATLGQFINDKLSTKPDATLGDLAHDLAVTAIATTISGPVQAGMTRTIAAAVGPYIKPADITPEQKDILTKALQAGLTETGVPPQVTDVVGMLGAVQTQQPHAIDVNDLVLPDKHPAVQEGLQRVYTVVPAGTPAPEHITWTSSLAEVQQMIDVMGPNVKIPYVDMSPEGLKQMQQGEDVQKIRMEQQVAEGNYVLPSNLIDKGTFLYNPQPAPTAEQVMAPQVPAPQPAPDARTVPERTLKHTQPDGTKVKVEFADVPSKQLFLFAKQSDEGAKYISQEDLAKTRTALAQVYGVSEDQVLPMAQFYRAKVSEVVNSIKADKVGMLAFSKETFEQLKVKENLPETQLRSDARKIAEKGKVTFAAGMKVTPHLRKMQAFLQKWLSMFAPNTSLIIFAESGGIYKSAAYLGNQNNVGLVVVPSERADPFNAVFTLAHEFGHHLFDSIMTRPEYAPALAELKLEHEALKARVGGMQAREFIRAWMPASRVLNADEMLLEASGVSPNAPAMELVAWIDSQRFEGYTLSFDEYAAEQFARYTGANQDVMLSGEVKSLWEEAYETLKIFFDKVVRKLKPGERFQHWMEYLRTVPPIEMSTTGQSALAQNLQSASIYFDIVDEQRRYTFRTITRLPQKEKILRQSVKEQLKRPDVREQERQIFDKVLATFDGDVIDRAQLTARLEQEIVPLKTEIKPYPFEPKGMEIAGYGLSRIGQNRNWGRYEGFYLPFEVEQDPHDGRKDNFGHARWFDDAIKPGGVEVVRSVVELQNDLQQHQKTLSPEARAQRIADAEKGIEIWTNEVARQVAHSTLLYQRAADPSFWTADLSEGRYATAPAGKLLFDLYSLSVEIPELERAGLVTSVKGFTTFFSWVSPTLAEEMREKINEKLENAREMVEDRRVELHALRAQEVAGVNLSILPERSWELMLRKLNSEASADGVKKMRMATADTVAKVEGWPKSPKYNLDKPTFIPELKGVEVEWPAPGDELGTGPYFLTGNIVNKMVEAPDVPFEPAIEFVDRTGTTYITDMYQDLIFNGAKVEEHVRRMWTYGRNQGIYNRYAKEITNFVKKEFGAREVTDAVAEERPGWSFAHTRNEPNTWLEWDVAPNLNGVPVIYYDTVDSIDNAATQLAAANPSLEVPKWFSRLQGFFQGSLKLSQMARLLPHIESLTRYRRLMQEMANMKSGVMAITNQRIKQWYSLSAHDSQGVMKMLEAEVQGGKHWTTLTEHDVALNGLPAKMWVHELTPQVMEEAQKRNISKAGVQLYIDVKNDYLTLLGLQEQTLLKALTHFFRKNPIVGSTRSAVATKMFNRLRQQPYIPDKRFGQYSVMVKAKADTRGPNGEPLQKGDKVWFSRHETESQQKKAFAEAKKMWGSDFTITLDFADDTQYSLRGLPREMIHSLPEALELTKEQQDKFDELYFDVTKEGRYLARFAKAKTRLAGYEEDMRRSYADHMWRASNAIAKMEYGWQLREQMTELSRAIRTAGQNGGDMVAIQKVRNYLQENYKYVMEPQHEWEQLRAVTALWYLWGVPKTALMNATTMLTTTYPRLAAIHGDAKATAAIIRAMKDVVTQWKTPEKTGKDVAALFAQARNDGTTAQSFAAEAAAVADGNAIEKLLPTYAFLKNANVKDKMRTLSWKMLHAGMVPFKVTEEFNRRATLLAAYRLNVEAGMAPITESKGEGSAYLSAKDTVDYTQNEYAAWDRAPMLRGKKSVALIFFSFVQNMSFFMFGGDKGWWRGWLVLAALSGIQGLPGAENVIDFLNWLGRQVFDEPVDLRLEAREMAQAIGMNPDWVMHGAAHSMFGLGWDSASSIGMGRIIPGTDAIFGQGDASKRILQMAGEIGGPFGGLTVNVLQSIMDDNPNSMVRFERMAPTVLRNLSRGVRGGVEDRWTDAQGRALIDEASGLEVLGQTLGFQPQAKTTLQEQRHLQSEAAQFYALRRQNLMAMMWQAKDSGDDGAVQEVQDKIAKYNESVPDPQLRITAKEIALSIKARQREAKALEGGTSAVKRYRPLYERIATTFTEGG